MTACAPGPMRVLLIDDETMSAAVLEAMLTEESDIELHCMTDGTRATEIAEHRDPDVILVDGRMPVVDGFDVILALKAHPPTSRIPVLMLSADDNVERKAHGFAAGAADYLVKWPARLELVARLRAHTRAYRAVLERDRAYEALAASRQALLERTDELVQAQNALREAEKFEAITKLTAGVAHDLNNMLQITSGHLQLLRMEARGDDRTRRRLDSAEDGLRRGARLATQLLSLARRQPLQPVTIDPATLLRGLHRRLAPQLPGHVSFNVVAQDGQCRMSADPARLEGALASLVGNACEAMDGGGTLTAAAACVSIGGADRPQEGELSPGDYVRITLEDTGSGMSPDFLRQAFEPFFTTRTAPRRAGLGLSMVLGFMKQSGGHIDLESRPGHGTIVTLYFPAAACDAASDACIAADARIGQQPVAKAVLIVEEEPDIRAAAAEVLQGLGYRVFQAADAMAAASLLHSGIAVDLVFTDVALASSAASAEIAAAMERCCPHAKVLIASGYARADLLMRGMIDDSVDLLRKPYRLDDLVRKIRLLLQRPAESTPG